MDVGSTQTTVALDLASATKKPASVDKPAGLVASDAGQSPEGAAGVSAIGVTKAQVEVAAVALREFAQSVRRDLSFSVEGAGGQVVVKVTDSTSGDVIRQIPSEEALQLAEHLSDARNILFKAEA
jgi:flagellar protein FlaG